MRLETKIAVDRWVGTIAIRGLLLLSRLSGQRRIQRTIQPKSIFVLKLLGLGSIIQATPLLTAIASLHPSAKIVFVTRRGNELLTDRLPGVSATLTMRDDGLLGLLVSIIRILRVCHTTPDLCFINLEAHSKLGALLTILSGAEWKAGFFRNPRDLVLARAFDRLVYFNQSAPISEVYLQLGRALGISAISPPLSNIHILAADEANADRFLISKGLFPTGTRIILVNPNASELRLERRWPAASFAQVIDKLASAEPDLRFVVIGSPGERSYAETILQRIPVNSPARVINGAGNVSLGGLIALIRRASLVITNDSGPMHIALSLSTPTIGLFGPVEPDHYACDNTSGASIFLYHRIYCSPCVHHFEVAPCGGNNICMRQISVEEVLAAAQTLLNTQIAPPTTYREISYWDKDRPIGIVGAQP